MTNGRNLLSQLLLVPAIAILVYKISLAVNVTASVGSSRGEKEGDFGLFSAVAKLLLAWI